MRTIKFRAWDKQYKKWCDIEKENDIRGHYMMNLFGEVAEVDISTGELDIDYLSNIELVQYTGLKDKNGKEIYEGDICRDSLGWVFAVEWDEDGRFIGKHSKPRGETYICYVGREPAVEVIGNIYENPELLEATE